MLRRHYCSRFIMADGEAHLDTRCFTIAHDLLAQLGRVIVIVEYFRMYLWFILTARLILNILSEVCRSDGDDAGRCYGTFFFFLLNGRMHLNNTIFPFNYSSPFLPGEHGVIVFLGAPIIWIISFWLFHILFEPVNILFLALLAVRWASDIA